MPFRSHYPKPVVLKALHWLKEQPDDWIERVKDVNVAVRMYLKSQGQNKERPSDFSKEIKQLLNGAPAGACLADKQPDEHCLAERKACDDNLGACLADKQLDNLEPKQHFWPSEGKARDDSLGACLADKQPDNLEPKERFRPLEGKARDDSLEACLADKQPDNLEPKERFRASEGKARDDSLEACLADKQPDNLKPKERFRASEGKACDASLPPEKNELFTMANPATGGDRSFAFFLDENSLQSIEKTKKELNLKSDQEALRLLIQLGQVTVGKLLAPPV